MGKQGPCYHCGVTSTPLWRNGPPEKPVLCNACGSRWRTKGTLANYTPLHSRVEPNDFEEHRVFKVKSVSFKSKETKLHKRKQCHNSELFEVEAVDFDQNFHKTIDEETCNRSSSSSAISYSDSCAQFGGTDASEFTGSSQTIVWDALVPSRKRTCMSRPKHSSVEKLTKDLYSILHEQQFSYFSGSSEEDLIFESGASMVSVEIGHGSILMKHPNAVTREEESEASSLSVDNKTCPINEAYSGSASLNVHIDKRGASYPYMSLEKAKKPMGQGTEPEHTKRDKSHHEKFQILRNHSSPLTSIDLKDVVTFEEFVRHLTPDEQQQLMKYLPSIDTGRLPDSLRSTFDSPQFAENISSFQKLLAEGVFDLSFLEMSTEECKTLKRLALVNLTKSKWTEHYNLLKDIKHNSAPMKRNLDGQNPNISGPKSTMRSPRRVVMKTNYDMKDLMDNELCFSPRSLFAFPPNKSSLMLDAFQFTDESFDQDILLDVPSNGSFPQAELLYPSSTFAAQEASASSSPRASLSQPYITS